MPEVPQPPEPALESQSGASLLSAISREMERPVVEETVRALLGSDAPVTD